MSAKEPSSPRDFPARDARDALPETGGSSDSPILSARSIALDLMDAVFRRRKPLDEALAEHCDRVVTLADGRIVSDTSHSRLREGSGVIA